MSFVLPAAVAPDTLLGEGVWGRVYALGNGMVLKLALPTGGLGDTVQKLVHEAKILQALSQLGQTAWRLPVPALAGHGALPPAHPLRQAGYIGWLCSTQCRGRVFQLAELATLPLTQQQAMAVQAGRALWTLHQALRAMQPALALEPDRVFADLPRELAAADRALVDQVQAWHEKLPGTALQPVHGDYNISNLLFDLEGTLTGIVDFAEACLSWPEDDLVSLTSELPAWSPALVATYTAGGGSAIDPNRLSFAAAKRALIGMIICRYRLNRPTEAAVNENELRAVLAKNLS